MDSRTRALVLGAAATVGLSFLGVVPIAGACCSCLALFASGVVSVWDYTRRERLTIPGGEGAQMGALAGCMAFGISLVLGLLVWLGFGMPNLADVIIPRIEEQMSRQPGLSPDQMDQVLGMYESVLASPALLVGISLVSLALNVAFGALGGVIGASVFKKGGDVRPEQTY